MMLVKDPLLEIRPTFPASLGRSGKKERPVKEPRKRLIVTSAQGEVYITNPDGTLIEAEPGMEVSSSQNLAVMEDSSATVEFISYDGTVNPQPVPQNTVIFGNQEVAQLENACAASSSIR